MQHFASSEWPQSSLIVVPSFVYDFTLWIGTFLTISWPFSWFFSYYHIYCLLYVEIQTVPLTYLYYAAYYCSSLRSFANITASSAYLILYIHSPFIMNPLVLFSSACLKICSEYRLNINCDKTHPCLTPHLIRILSESSSSIRTVDMFGHYRLLIIHGYWWLISVLSRTSNSLSWWTLSKLFLIYNACKDMINVSSSLKEDLDAA